MGIKLIATLQTTRTVSIAVEVCLEVSVVKFGVCSRWLTDFEESYAR